jgi:phosphate transport system protein
MDLGLEQLTNMILDMANVSEKSVITAIKAFTKGKDMREEIFQWSEELRILNEQVGDLAVELIARYQPVAASLRFIKSCMELSYGFLRFGRYAFDIIQVLGVFGDLSRCDYSYVEKMGEKTIEMIHIGIEAFKKRDARLADTLHKLDDVIDHMYADYIQQVIHTQPSDVICSLSATLILRYLERIADHACSIGDSVIYIVTGKKPV